jgi:hypothetical protein
MARKCAKPPSEDRQDPDEYVEYWNLEEEEGIDASQMKKLALDLSRYVDEINVSR